jgi:hypothetical protein
MVLRSGFSTMNHGRSAPTSSARLRPPSRDEPRKTSGQAKCRTEVAIVR